MRKLLICLLLLIASTQQAFGEEISYSDVFSEGFSPLGFSDDSIRFADVSYPLQRCKPDDDYVCVVAKSFVFSVPRKDPTLSTWTHNGAVYNAYDRKPKMLFGKLINYRIIHQRWQHHTVEYMYSNEYGIVAIREGKNSPLALSSDCGLAAIVDTYGCVYKSPQTQK